MSKFPHDGRCHQDQTRGKPARSPSAEIDALRLECRDLADLYEKAVARANTLAVEAEIARLEFRQVFDAVGDATCIIDGDYRALRINQSFLDLIGAQNRINAIGKNCYDLLGLKICSTDACCLKHALEGKKKIEAEVEYQGQAGPSAPYLITTSPLYGLSEEIIGVVVQYKDITNRKQYEKALEKANVNLKRLSSIDGLTQLANRRIFDERIENEWRRAMREKQPLGLVIGDIDCFKRYNDHYGHPMGDACLKSVAATIGDCARRPADLTARYGGEEFVVLLPNTPPDGTRHMAETIRRAVCGMELAHADSDAGEHVSLSLGAASVIPTPVHGANAVLIRAADRALYEAKAAGRNRVVLGAVG